MSIMRSFTVRRKQPELEPSTPIPNLLGRAASQRGGRPVVRAQISSPVALVSTTNMLSFNAPDIIGTEPVENRDTSSSSEESDGTASTHSHETDPTDISSPEASPISVEPNHLTQFFKAATEEATKRPERSQSAGPSSDSPVLPRRALSHSKRAHEALSRKRSVQRARSVSAQGRGLTTVRSSADIFNPSAMLVEEPRESPFGPELSKLDETEELGSSPIKSSDPEQDALYLKSRGLARLDAATYIGEIDNLVAILFDDKSPAVPDFSGWF